MNLPLRWIALWVILTLVPRSASSLEPNKALTQYVHASWGIDQGLPQSHVYSVAQTSEGYLWATTQEGFVRFDGVRFTVFDKSTLEQIRNNHTKSLLASRDGSLYVGTDGGGLVRLHGDAITLYTTQQGLPSDSVTALHESADGSVWIGTAVGLSRLVNGRIVPLKSDKLPHATVTAITEDWSGRLWIGTLGGLASYKDGQLSRHISDGFPASHILALYPSQDGSLWIGTNGSGLHRYRSGRFRVYAQAEGLASKRISAVYEDRSGTVWIGTLDHGFGRLRDERVEFYSGEPEVAVASFLEDREGNLWIGTANGLHRLADGKVITFAVAEGLIEDNVRSVLADGGGRLWVGTRRGVHALGQSGRFTRLEGLTSDRVRSMWSGRDGSFWIGTDDGGLNHVDGGRVTAYTTANGLSSDMVLAIREDRQGHVWVGTARGLQRIVDGRITPPVMHGTFSGEAVGAIFEDRSGALWFGTQDGGVNRLLDGRVTSFTQKNGLSSDFVLAIHQDSYGTIWVGTAGGGLNRYKGGRFTAITTRQGLFDDNVFAILEDQASNLWMSCNKGIFRVSIGELNAVADGALASVHSISYGRGDGMKSRECNGGMQPVAWKTADGKLWFATTKGVAMVDPAELRMSATAPPVMIEGVFADRNRVGSSGASPKLPAGTKTLEFHYASLSFAAPEKIRFQYKLDGFDEQWIEAGTRRAAYYTNVPPGKYQFRVRAAGEAGRWNGQNAVVSLSLQPFFYQTPWFWAASVLSLIGLAWNAHRSRVQLIRTSAERFKLLFDRNLAGVYRATIDGRILDCNDAYARILGYSSRNDMKSKRVSDFYWNLTDGEELLRRLSDQGMLSNVETCLRRKDGEAVWVLENISLASGAQNEKIIEATLIDISGRKRAEDQIRYQAYHDALTGLLNRSLFTDRLTKALAHAHRRGSHVAVLFLDLDRFKLINDTLGHTVGDHLLQGTGARLKTCVREEDSVARLGGDEFTLLLMDLKSVADATVVARKILETVARPITVDGNELYVTTSIGISISPADGEDAEALLKNADNALYRAKDAGRNNYQLCTPSMSRIAADRLSLENALHQAIERQEFVVHYQPQFDLRSGRVVGVEALIRWDRPGKGIIRPNEFIPAAEESRLILPIGEWVLQTVCRQAKTWQQVERYPVRVAVNFSAGQFQQQNLPQIIRNALDHWALGPGRLEMEITESTAMQNPELTADILQQLKKLGISIVIDDFGVGHSSLNYLKRFPIDGLKIDRTFVQDITRDESDAAIVSAVIAMARALKLRVVAEGVETEEQLAFLETHDCFEIQGYLFSRPLPAEAMTELLRSGTVAVPPRAKRPSPLQIQGGHLTDH